MSLPILYQDEHCVVIDKPSGLLVHRSRIATGVKEFALQKLRDQLGQHVFPIHRLDRPTSGILLFALDAQSARVLSDQFTAREVTKEYHAVVRGYLHGEGVVDYPLKEELDKLADAQADEDKAAQEAITRYRSLAQIELPFAVGKRYPTSRYSLVQLFPETGRRHQLRRHMAHLRHPIIGDSNHGDNRHNRFFQEHFQLHRLLLAATRLRFQQPVTGETVDIQLPIPTELQRPFQSLE